MRVAKSTKSKNEFLFSWFFLSALFPSLFVLFFLFAFTPSAFAATISRPPTNLGLVGYWSMDDGAGLSVTDGSGNANTGTLSGTSLPTWTNGKRGKGLSFAGSGDPAITIASNSNINFGTGSFSVSMWGYFRDFAYPKAWFMIKKSNSCYTGAGDAGWDIGHSYNGEGIYICYTDGTNLIQNGSVTFDSGYKPADLRNTWVNLVVVFDKSAGRVKFYVNGVKQTNEYDISTVTGSVSGSDNLTIGTMYGWQTDAILDDTRIYNRALSASEASSIYKNGQTTRKQVSNSGLVGYWSFNEGSGIVAGDSSGNGNSGLLRNMDSASDWVRGKRGLALDFDGLNDDLQIPDVDGKTDFDTNDNFTVSAWIYTESVQPNTDTSGNMMIEKWGDGGTPYPYVFRYYNQNSPSHGKVVVARYDGTNNPGVSSSVAINDGKFHMVTFVKNGSTLILYIDGINDGQTTDSTTGTTLNTSRLYIASRAGSYPFKGKVDDLRIYNRALSATEIANLYKQNETKLNSSQNGKLTNGLVGLWSFDGADISGSTAYDRSVSGRNSTLYGNPSMMAGKIGQGVNFTGTSQYTTASGFSEPGTSNQPYTFAAWVRPATGETAGNIIHMSASADGLGWCIPPLTITGNKAKAESWNGGGVSVTGTTNVPSGSWTHIATTWDVTGGLKIYVNGTLDNSTPQATYSASGGSNYIWISYSAGACSGDSGDFDGDIDDVRIYSRALSASEMKQLYLMGK